MGGEVQAPQARRRHQPDRGEGEAEAAPGEAAADAPPPLRRSPRARARRRVAQIVAEKILGDLKSDYTLSLNASDERGINTVRERVKIFASYSDRREGVPFRLVILDEADEMTRDAQTALRRIMEESSRFTRFILICNYSSNIIEPIQSRCAIFRFQRVGSDEVAGDLKKIAKNEKREDHREGASERSTRPRTAT